MLYYNNDFREAIDGLRHVIVCKLFNSTTLTSSEKRYKTYTELSRLLKKSGVSGNGKCFNYPQLIKDLIRLEFPDNRPPSLCMQNVRNLIEN